MNVCAYTPLHYGKHYLRWAVAAVEPVAEKHIILYTPKPSYGYQTALPCPDTEEELRACVAEFNHVEWHTGEWPNESNHRGAVMQYLPQNCEILLPVDADEVWDIAHLKLLLTGFSDERDWRQKDWGVAREWRLYGFVHHWRSFAWACTDALPPTRIIDLRQHGGTGYATGKLHHFGYAQPLETIKYKWSCHGHQAELRNGWLERFSNWRPGEGDVHPTNVDFWTPEPYPLENLPEILHDHPFYGQELIV